MNPQNIQRHLGQPLPMRCFASLDSTNAYAKRWAAAGAPHGATVFADAQTQGRGRRGHSFFSPEGGLYMSLIVDSGVAVDNPHKDEVEVQVNPWLTGTHAAKWFLVCTTRGIKPISVQKREVGPLNRWDQPHDACVKDHNEAHYGLHYRGAAAGVNAGSYVRSDPCGRKSMRSVTGYATATGAIACRQK